MDASASRFKPLILASGSPYRNELLKRLGLPFGVEIPNIDEALGRDESPDDAVVRLASAKAQAVASSHSDAVVLGSDQLAVLDGATIGKPGTPERAREQLQRVSGRSVRFLTAIAVACDGSLTHELDVVHVRFRTLDEETIARYVDADAPLDCAGALRSEGLGVTLLESIESDDPTSLIGLPLIRVARLLRGCGYRLP